MLSKGSLLHYLQMGAKMHILEWLPIYILPIVFLWTPPPERELFLANAGWQLALFIPMVQIPAYVFDRMTYVDLGWPCGLVLLGFNCARLGSGWWLRKYLVCACMLFHGGRMFLVGILQFGKNTNWTYIFKEDLPRYQYAKVRWEKDDGMPVSMWWFKVQHDTLQQCMANSVILAAPIVFAASNPEPSFHPIEVVGLITWAVAWVTENRADMQKQQFMKDVRSKIHQARAQGDSKLEEDLKVSVLGYAPFDGPSYSLWTLCRHPNYFCEWCCWVGFVVMGIPSLSQSWHQMPLAVGLSLVFTYYGCIRFFYDCLLHWTGAGPAEHFSVAKRPAFKVYQQSTRCFWPFAFPLLPHYQTPGWPDA